MFSTHFNVDASKEVNIKDDVVNPGEYEKILRTVRALISLTVRAACKITTSNKPAKSHRDKSKQTNSSKDIYQYYGFYWKHSFCHLLSLPLCV